MEQDTEQKLKIETETSLLKREYKHALDNLTRVKSDTNDIIALRDKVTIEIHQRNGELNEILLEISNAKLKWMAEKQSQLDELNDKNAQADNIIKRKAELNEQEEELRKIEADDVEIRNETRRLELKVQAEKDSIDTEKRQLEEDEKELNKREEKLSNDIKDFKKKVSDVLIEVQQL